MTAYRRDGFDGAIEVSLAGLPAGVEVDGRRHPGGALERGDHPDGERRCRGRDDAVGIRSRGCRRPQVVRQAHADEKVSVLSVAAPPDVRVVSVDPAFIELAPGGHAKVRATIARENEFKGRVPLAVLNLPFRVTVPDIGLNGILITEAQDSREFVVAAENAAPAEQTLFVTARVEVNSTEPNERASTPIILRILPATGTPTSQPEF